MSICSRSHNGKKMFMKVVLSLIFLLVGGSLAHADTLAEPGALDETRLQLGSVSAVVLDKESGATLYSKRPDAVVPIASITKVMTAMVVLDSEQSLDELLEIVKPDLNTRKNDYSRMRIGSMARRGDLLRIALMSSENLAAWVLGYHYAGGMDAFISAMNQKAESLNMTRTRFVDTSGLFVDNRSTATDLGKMVIAAAGYDLIREYTTTRRYHVNFQSPRYQLGYANTNPLTRRGSWNIHLSKTGYLTEAGRCLVMLTLVDEREIAMVLLDSFGTKTPIGDAGRVKRWIETGSGGPIADAARRYSREKGARYD